MLRNVGSLTSVFAPLPPSPGSTVHVRFFWVSARQSPAPESPPGLYLPLAAHRPGPHLCGRLSAAPSPLRPGDPGPRAPPRAPSPARRPEQGDRHSSTVTQPCAARGALPLPSAGQRGHRAAAGSEVRGAAPGDPRPAAARPCTCCSFRPAAPPSPPGRLRLCHPGALASSSAGLRLPSRRRPRDAGSAPNGEGARTQASRGRPPGAGTGSGSAGPHRAALGPGRSCTPVGAARVLRSSVAGGRPRAADRTTLSRGQLPELGGINRVPPGLESGDEGRRLFLIVAVWGHPRRPPGLADCASHPGPETQREIRRLTQGKGWGRDPGKQRAAEGGGDPRRGGGGAPRHRKQSGAGPRGLGPGVGWGGGMGWGRPRPEQQLEDRGRLQRNDGERWPIEIRPGARSGDPEPETRKVVT